MEEDLISQLHDDILLLILDKINIYEAFKTTFLSKRWNNLWRSLPRLHFRVHSPPFYVFPYIISDLLSHRDDAAPVHDFHLSFDTSYRVDGEFVEKCVLYAINHGVQSLRICLRDPRYCELPAAVFSCKTLQELELRNLRNPVKVPGRLSLPNLKTLILKTSSLVFEDDDVRTEPFSGLPELEKLTLDSTSFGWIVFKTPKLRVLEITNVFRVKEIYAPLLTSFRYNYYKAWKCAKVDLPMLEIVYLDITSTRYDYNHVHKNFVRMLHQFRNATTVSLTSNTLKVLERNGGPFEKTTPHPFPNMKCLKVIRRRYGIRRVSEGVINYLMGTLCCELELSRRVFVVEQTCDEDEDDYEKYGYSYSYYDYSD